MPFPSQNCPKTGFLAWREYSEIASDEKDVRIVSVLMAPSGSLGLRLPMTVCRRESLSSRESLDIATREKEQGINLLPELLFRPWKPWKP